MNKRTIFLLQFALVANFVLLFVLMFNDSMWTIGSVILGIILSIVIGACDRV